MTGPMVIAQAGTAALRLFHIDAGQPAARTLAEAPTPAIIAAGLGLPALPQGGAEVIRLADIAALGLRDFLMQGHDVLPADLCPGSDGLDDLEGHVLIVHPAIAAAGDVTLTPAPWLRPLGAFRTGMPDPAALHLPEPERLVTITPPSPAHSPRHRGGRVVALLIALAVLLLGVSLWPR